jgi:hypothetical protein
MRSKATPVTAASPRWGFGKPEHPEIGVQIREGIPGYRRFLADLAEHKAVLHSIPHSTDSPEMPHWQNGYFSALDGAALLGFLLDWKPARYVEIGSGNSTKFARFAIRSANLPTHMTSIDPNPRAEIDAIVDRPIRAKLQSCDLGIFQELLPGDLLFFDGSHLLTMNSDVVVFFLEILPRLKPGILVHVHDVFLPFDYIPRFAGRQYNEQYMLALFLLYARPKIALPNYFVCADPELREMVRDIFRAPEGGTDISLHYRNIPELTGVSFWFGTPHRGPPSAIEGLTARVD